MTSVSRYLIQVEGPDCDNDRKAPMLHHAIENNATWCQTVCSAHGVPGEFHEDFWVNRHRVPMFYSNLIRLSRREEEFQETIRMLLESDLPKPWSIKDSFGTLDLSAFGFTKLFDASWIVRPPDRTASQPPNSHIVWSVLEDAADLIPWEKAWEGNDANTASSPQPRLWIPKIFHDPQVTFLTGKIDEEIVAVGIANRTGNVVGLSNVFARIDTGGDHWPGIIAATTALFPGIPIVGYKRGQDLSVIQQLGFHTIGELTVWIVES